jgi:hypothetical protein
LDFPNDVLLFNINSKQVAAPVVKYTYTNCPTRPYTMRMLIEWRQWRATRLYIETSLYITVVTVIRLLSGIRPIRQFFVSGIWPDTCYYMAGYRICNYVNELNKTPKKFKYM